MTAIQHSAGAMMITTLLCVCIHRGWIEPPPDEVEWLQTADGRYDVEVRNLTGEILVHPADVDSITLWRIELDHFDPRRSTIALVNDGKTLVHVRGKHAISQLNDAAVYIVDRSGPVMPVSARHFTSRIVATERRYSHTPTYTWYSGLLEIADDRITLLDAVGERRTVCYDAIRALCR